MYQAILRDLQAKGSLGPEGVEYDPYNDLEFEEPVLALDPTSARPPRELVPKGALGRYPTFSADGKLLAFTNGSVIRVWGLGARRELVTFDDHRVRTRGSSHEAGWR